MIGEVILPADPLLLPSFSADDADTSDRALTKVSEAMFDQLLTTNPGAAIWAAWTPVRESLERAAEYLKIEHLNVGSIRIASHLVDKGCISSQLADAVANLRTLREEAQNRVNTASPVDAIQFRSAAREIAAAIYGRLNRFKAKTPSVAA